MEYGFSVFCSKVLRDKNVPYICVLEQCVKPLKIYNWFHEILDMISLISSDFKGFTR